MTNEDLTNEFISDFWIMKFGDIKLLTRVPREYKHGDGIDVIILQLQKLFNNQPCISMPYDTRYNKPTDFDNILYLGFDENGEYLTCCHLFENVGSYIDENPAVKIDRDGYPVPMKTEEWDALRESLVRQMQPDAREFYQQLDAYIDMQYGPARVIKTDE